MPLDFNIKKKKKDKDNVNFIELNYFSPRFYIK